MVRKGMSLEPEMTIKLRKVVALPSVTIHGGIELNNQTHLFDNITFCDNDRLSEVYESMDEVFCISLVEKLKINFMKSLNEVKYGITDN